MSSATRPVVAGDWSGRVLDSGGMPIGRARVTLLSADGGFFREASTDPSGAYAFPDAPAGGLTLGACAPGYEYQEAAGISGGLEFALGQPILLGTGAFLSYNGCALREGESAAGPPA